MAKNVRLGADTDDIGCGVDDHHSHQPRKLIKYKTHWVCLQKAAKATVNQQRGQHLKPLNEVVLHKGPSSMCAYTGPATELYTATPVPSWAYCCNNSGVQSSRVDP